MKKIFPALVLLMTAFSGTMVLADQGNDKTPKKQLLEAHIQEHHSRKTKPARKVSGKAKKGAPQVSSLPVKKGQ
jgi:hypothetical protein